MQAQKLGDFSPEALHAFLRLGQSGCARVEAIY